jgi:hypothetical protein
MLLLPVIAVSTWVVGLAIFLNGSVPLGAAILLALVLGVGAVIFFVADQGNTVFEIGVGSLLAIVMFFCVWPLLMKLKERRLAIRAPVAITRPSTSPVHPDPSRTHKRHLRCPR